MVTHILKRAQNVAGSGLAWKGAARSLAVRIGTCAMCARLGGRGGIGTAGACGAGPRGGAGKRQKHKKRTVPSVPKWSPTSVLTGPDQAQLLKSDGFRCIPSSMAVRISHGRTFRPGAGGGPRPEGRPMKNSAKRDANGGQGDKDAPKTGKTGSSAEKYAQMGASGPKKMASMGLPPHPPVTQAGRTRTNPTPSGGGVRNGRDTINPYP